MNGLSSKVSKKDSFMWICWQVFFRESVVCGVWAICSRYREGSHIFCTNSKQWFDPDMVLYLLDANSSGSNSDIS